MGWRRSLLPLASDMGAILIHLLVERHDPSNGADGDITAVQQTPDPETARIGMAFLPVLDLKHEGEPDLADRGRRRPALVLQTAPMFGFKPAAPEGDGRPGDV